MGVFEMEAFAKGTFAVADTLAEITSKVTVVTTPTLLHYASTNCVR
jgi:3-phosphoglycerate kinase